MNLCTTAFCFCWKRGHFNARLPRGQSVNSITGFAFLRSLWGQTREKRMIWPEKKPSEVLLSGRTWLWTGFSYSPVASKSLQTSPCLSNLLIWFDQLSRPHPPLLSSPASFLSGCLQNFLSSCSFPVSHALQPQDSSSHTPNPSSWEPSLSLSSPQIGRRKKGQGKFCLIAVALSPGHRWPRGQSYALHLARPLVNSLETAGSLQIAFWECCKPCLPGA